jgi:hypothetical protein
MCSALNAAINRVAKTSVLSANDIRGAYTSQVKTDKRTSQKQKGTRDRNRKALEAYGSKSPTTNEVTAQNERNRRDYIASSLNRRVRLAGLGYRGNYPDTPKG